MIVNYMNGPLLAMLEDKYINFHHLGTLSCSFVCQSCLALLALTQNILHFLAHPPCYFTLIESMEIVTGSQILNWD
jgi:hypothetical protein